MTEVLTIRIPANMDELIAPIDHTIEVGLPLHVAGEGENPDDFCLAFYAQPDTDTTSFNDRATMIAAAATADKPHAHLHGDILMVGDPGLLQKIVESDEQFHKDAKVIKAFKAWLLDYSEINEVDDAHVFYTVNRYTNHVMAEAVESSAQNHAEQIAAMMGLDPRQVGVFYV